MDVTPSGGGQDDERAVAEKNIEKDRLYVMDRGHAKFALFNSIVKKQSSCVSRLRDKRVKEVAQDHALSETAIAADVLSN
ncbi:hypothetical protein CA13_52840 [Planctomycetes bacterium CA13]|uniref:Transposase IS4-like domain-containing protein n=1 Tax=Novipirellula herctigrandis TaxID=2527986 RepID=A0A5C5ZB78_9BACT|nr:hypothetical protein CA13_52840 [Planctomycetes bacterium CA13]